MEKNGKTYFRDIPRHAHTWRCWDYSHRGNPSVGYIVLVWSWTQRDSMGQGKVTLNSDLAPVENKSNRSTKIKLLGKNIYFDQCKILDEC